MEIEKEGVWKLIIGRGNPLNFDFCLLNKGVLGIILFLYLIRNIKFDFGFFRENYLFAVIQLPEASLLRLFMVI